MNYGIEDQAQLEAIETLLRKDLVDAGVHCVMLIDMAGNTIASVLDEETRFDTCALAALAAGSFATVDSMAGLVGEKEFSLLFHKGEDVSIHFSRVTGDLLLVSIFPNTLSLGLLRLKAMEAVERIGRICSPPREAETGDAVMG